MADSSRQRTKTGYPSKRLVKRPPSLRGRCFLQPKCGGGFIRAIPSTRHNLQEKPWSIASSEKPCGNTETGLVFGGWEYSVSIHPQGMELEVPSSFFFFFRLKQFDQPGIDVALAQKVYYPQRFMWFLAVHFSFHQTGGFQVPSIFDPGIDVKNKEVGIDQLPRPFSRCQKEEVVSGKDLSAKRAK